MSGDPPLIDLPESVRPLLEAARAVLATPDRPPVVFVGGLAVTMRVGGAVVHRATVDIDLVADDVEPEAVEVLAAAHATPKEPLFIGDVKVDIIPTSPISTDDLDGLEDVGRSVSQEQEPPSPWCPVARPAPRGVTGR